MRAEGGAGRVLIHGDPCAANLVIDPEAGRLVGMFDFEYAALADRHEDFYSLHSFGDAFTERALDAYATASGVRPSIRWAALHHVYAAFHALAGALATDDPAKVANQLRWVQGALAGTPGRLLGIRVARTEAMSRPSIETSD
jgi:aminoglycoside phosphotransferase (APT) family kinase protein